MEIKKHWYKEMAVYQIWPRSFKDGNGDGIGDLKGVLEKLDYIKNLGVDAIWFSPLYKSPQHDFGYDIADYRDIAPEYGTMDDFKAVLAGCKQRGLRVIMDLVVNHTSNEHEWFLKSRERIEPYTDYYIWRKGRGKDGKKAPNNWTATFPWSRLEVGRGAKGILSPPICSRTARPKYGQSQSKARGCRYYEILVGAWRLRL